MKKITMFFAFFLAFMATGYAQFPAPYCPVAFSNGTEPITLVNFAGINNASPAPISAPAAGNAHEDFTAVTGAVTAGSAYPIIVKGNTDGNWTTYIRLFADWNHDNDFLDAGESYDLGTVVNSTGLDAVQLTSNVAVPGDALAGSTRMRVVKKWNSYSDSCNTVAGTNYGQAEDYTLTVTIPACTAPTAGLSTVTSGTTADLSWTSAGTNAEIVVQLATASAPAVADGTGVDVVGNTYPASGLTANTQYEFYVRNECTAGTSFSDWSGPYAFVTTIVPGCASNPTPADAAVNVPVGVVPFAWTAPTTGDPVDSYDLYYGLTAGNANILVGNFTTTSADITITGYSTTFYWKIVPKNAGGAAVGCGEWSFSTVATPPVPANDACSGAIAITGFPYTNSQDAFSATNNAGFITSCAADGGMNDGVWYTVVGNGFDLTVSATNVVGWDPQIDVYTGSCGTFTCVTYAESGGASGSETAVIEDSVLGTTYYINIGQYSATTDNPEGPFTLNVITGTSDAPDYVGLQYPATATFLEGGSVDVYGQVYEAGLTDLVPLNTQAPGIESWIAFNDTNTDPGTWGDDQWVVADYNPGYVGNNDEYMLNIGSDLTPGTYYYSVRFRLNNGVFVYGGTNGTDGSFWDGTTYVNGVMTINANPVPANDDCGAAAALTPGGTFGEHVTNGTNYSATDSIQADPTSCLGYAGGDVWYSVVVPASGNLTIETGDSTLGAVGFDSVITVYSGDCATPNQVGCDDDGAATAAYSKVVLTGQTPGATLLIRVYEYNNDAGGNFGISAYDASLGTNSFNNNNFAYYPNPVKDVLNLSHTANISKVAVYNLLGQQVIAKSINATQSQIDMSNLARGTYMVKVTADNKVQTIKVIKE